jgi:HAD superfamily hydrolase (TIGR01662 family)
MTPPRAVLVDVGFTLVVCDTEEIATIAGKSAVRVEPEALDAAQAQLHAELQQYSWASHAKSQAPKSGALFFRRLLELSGAVGDLDTAATTIWESHLRRNLWRRPLPGAAEGLASLRGAGVRLAVVSNSEGTVETLLNEIGLGQFFDTIVDSWVVGIAKPDPRIFQLALTRLGIAANEAMMVGDSLVADIQGAEAAGIRGVLIDPFGHHEEATVPRYRSLRDFAIALTGDT